MCQEVRNRNNSLFMDEINFYQNIDGRDFAQFGLN